MARYLKNEDVIRFSFKTGGLFCVTDSAVKQPATELKTLPGFFVHYKRMLEEAQNLWSV